MSKKIEKVKDFSFIRKGPYYSDIFNQIQGYPPPPFYKYARDARCLFIICVIVYNLYYCCYAKTSSSAVQKRHSKVYGNLIAPSFYSILLAYMPLCGTRNSIINSNRKKNIINPFLFFMYIYLFLIYMLQLMMYETRTGFLVLLNPFNDYFLYFPGMY